MAISPTPNLGLPQIEQGQAGAHVAFNDAMLGIDDTLGRGHGAAGGFLRLAVHEITLSGLSGAHVTAAGLIPARCIVLGVTAKVLAAVTGAASFDCGLSAGASQFGGSLGIALGSQNVGVVGPFAVYAATDVVLSANGGSFSGGNVLLVAHVIEVGAA